MDYRANKRRGSFFDLTGFETDLSVRVEWVCINHAAVADLDLSCAVYDRKGECLDVIDFSNFHNANHSIELRGDSMQSKVGQDSNEEVFLDLERLPKRVKAMVFYASSLSGNLHTVSKITASINRMRFADEIVTGQRIHAKWETTRVIDQRPIWEGRVELTHKQAHSCNTVGLFKFVREKDRWTAVFDAVPFYSMNQKERLRFSEQHMLVHVFPWLKTEEQRVLPSIKAVCAALSSMSMPALKPSFLEVPNRKLKPGLVISDFVKVLFKQLVSEDPRLTELKEATHVVALLHELFRQIDVNGDDQVDWEEFTSYCIEEGVISTSNSRDNARSLDDGAGQLSYAEDKASLDSVGDSVCGFLEGTGISTGDGIMVLIEIRSSRRVVAIEKDSIYFRLYNTHGGYINKYTAEGLPRAPRHYNIKIFDAAFVPERQTLCLSCSDQTISLVLERHEGQSREPKGYLFIGKLLHSMLPRKLTWSPTAQRLLCAGTNDVLYLWDLDKQELTGTVATGGHGMLLDLLLLKDKGLIATSFVDGCIHLWSEDYMRPKGVLEGHKLGVRTMAYAQNVLLSAGFEFEMLMWDVTNREQSMVLKGHKHPIVKVALMAAPAQKDDLLAVSCDEVGIVKIWDLIHTSGGHAQVLQTFQVPYIDAKRKITGFVLPFDSRYSLKHFSNIIFGSGRLSHFTPKQIFRPFVPPRLALLNQTSMRFIISVGADLHMWEATTGRFFRMFSGITPSISGITCGTLDSPRDRRLFLGDEGGNVLLLNTINGSLLNKVSLHCKEVTCLAYCGTTGYIMSTGADGRLVMALECKGAINEVRVIEQAHTFSISCLCYSSRLSLLATSSADGYCHLWDFQTARNATISIRAQREVTAVLFLDPYSVLVTGDSDGAVVLWHVRAQEDGSLRLLRRLTPGGVAASAIVTLLMLPDEEENEEALILATNEGGELLKWTVAQAVEGLGIKPVPDADCPGLQDRFNPHLKVSRNLAAYHVPSTAYDSRADVASETLPPSVVLHAHLETVPMCFTSRRPPAVVTVSHDGFLRIWSPSLEPLGEVTLPGVDATRMTDRDRFMDKVEYKFGRDDIHVSLTHETLAQTFLGERDMTLQSGAKAHSYKSLFGAQGRSRSNSFVAMKGTMTPLRSGNTKAPMPPRAQTAHPALKGQEASVTRKRVSTGVNRVSGNVSFLDTMVEDKDSNSTPRGTVVVSTRGGRSSMGTGTGFTESAGMSGMSGLLGTSTVRASMALTQLADAPPITRKAAAFALPGLTVRKKTFKTFGGGTTRDPSNTAFTIKSLTAGGAQGFFDLEAIQLLSYFRKNPDRQMVYNKEYPWTLEAARDAIKQSLEATRRSVADAGRLDLSVRYANVNAILNNPKTPKNPVMRGIFRASSSSHVRHSHMLEQLRADSNVSSKPRIYTCERMALSDDQILGEDDLPEFDGQFLDTASVLFDNNDPNRSRSPSPDVCEQAPIPMPRPPVNEQAITDRVASAMAEKDGDLKVYRPPTVGRSGRYTVAPRSMDKSRHQQLTTAQIVAEATRPGALGPHYTPSNVMQFRALFNKVDQDLNGTLSSEEWEQFLRQMSHKVPSVLGRKLFLTLDRDRDGTVTIRELVPIIFNRATPYQHQLIIKLIDHENSKMVVRETLSKEDIIKLFEFIDEKKKGFLTYDEVAKALTTLQISAAKTKPIHDAYRNEDHLFQKREFVELIWNLVCV